MYWRIRMESPTKSQRQNGARISNFAPRIGFFALALLTVLQQATAPAAAPRTVALAGQGAPGTSGGVHYASFGSFHHPSPFSVSYFGPVLNDAGQIAFRANLAGDGVDWNNHQGIWSEGSGRLGLVARTGSQAPGAPEGVNFASFPNLELYSPVLNNAGQIAFYGGLGDGSLGLWSEGSGGLAMVAADGQPAAGTEIGVVHSFANLDLFLETPVLNDAGATAFRSFLTGGGINDSNNIGLWSGSSGDQALVARLGSHAPGAPVGVNFGSPQPHAVFDEYRFSPVLNNRGQTVIYSQLMGNGINSNNDDGIWSGDAESLALVARAGSQAPGLSGGVNYNELAPSTAINSAGHVAFVAGLTGDSSTLYQDGIWSDRSGAMDLVARRGSQAPGTPAGVSFELFRIEVTLNDADQIAFYALLAGNGLDSTNDRGIWLEDSGSMTLVARAGNQAPGTPDGVNYSHFSPFQVGQLTLNAAGQVAYGAVLTGDGVDSTNNIGIWATDAAGVAQLLARTGQQLKVAPDDFRTISDLEFVGGTGNSNGLPSGFNNLGQLAFWASFTDGSEGVFLSNKVGNFAWQHLTKVHFFGADLSGADLTGADARGVSDLNLSGVTTTNLIHPDGHMAGINLAAGEKLVAYAGVPIPVKVTGEFSIATGATFDITDNAAIVDYTGASPVATVREKILSGRGGSGLGKGWNGMGITSSAAATANTTEPESRSVGYAENATMPLGPFTTFRGQAVDGTSILIAFTRTGDANLDGVVNDDDVTIVGATYAPGVPQPSWGLGDFDYNGFVDDDDVTLLGAFYDPNTPPPLAAPGASVSAVPEPETVALFVTGLIAIAMAAVVRRKPCQR
jgi:hypothetical protein